MITQKMLYEIELAMLRAYARASRKIAKAKTAKKGKNAASGQNEQNEQNEQNVVSLTACRDLFVKEFVTSVKEKRSLFEKEIAEGGYRDPAKLADVAYNLIESRLNSELTQRLMKHKMLDENSFRKMVGDLKIDLREVFYENYFQKSRKN